jgi:hypothetical protein
VSGLCFSAAEVGLEIKHACQISADVACVALNQLLPRYIRHDVDFSFYLSEAERQEKLRQIEDSVTKAWAYVLERKKRT